MSVDPTARFSGRADAYARYRPTYPAEALTILADRTGLADRSVVADFGAGTGVWSRRLLETGAEVIAVEPNEEMRRAAEAELGTHPRFRSVPGRAEASTLPDASVDLVTAAQAFHWFDVSRTRAEMRRVLRGAGHVALVWNDRDLESTPFLRAYEALLVAHCPSYRDLQGKAENGAAFDALFGRGRWSRAVVPNEQRLDREGLVGRVLSSSYAAQPGEPGHAALVDALNAVFDAHAEGPTPAVVLRYATVLIVGSVRPEHDGP